MKIAILAWGSLVWDPRNLPVNSGWELNGPKLPIEFSRISKDARLTLVIDPDNGVEVSTRFARSKRTCLIDAVADLREREGTIMRHIGFTDKAGGQASSHESDDKTHQVIHHWLTDTDFDAVVWTALPSNYLEEQSHKFTIDHAAAYLQALPATPRTNALNYILKAPSEVKTPLRKHLTDKGILCIEYQTVRIPDALG